MPSPTHHGTMKVVSKKMTWDASDARAKLAKWASSDGSGDKDKIDWRKYGQGFAYYPEGAEDIGDFKYPHHTVIDGDLALVPRGLYAAAARYAQNGGSAEIGTHIRRHYTRDLKEEPPDALATVALAFGRFDIYQLTPAELQDEADGGDTPV